MKIRFILPIILSLVSFCPLVWSAPEILNYSGRITVSGEPYSGQGYFKFALVNRGGTISYWTNDGNYTLVQEPASAVATQVNGGVYSVQLGDGAVANMQAIPGQIFKDHNDVHLRIWFAQSASGPFDLLSPDQAVTSVPYSLNGGGGANVPAGSGSTVQQTTVVEGGRVLTTGDLVRLVATGPANPSQTLILLAGDEVDIVTYSAGQPARLEYSFGEHTFAIPQTKDGLEIMQTLMGPGAIRLTAATGHQTLAVLRVRRTDGRAPTLLYGGESNASQPSGPAVVSLPKTRTVVRGGATTLFVSASGKNLSYQWKKNGQDLSNTPSGGSPSPGSARILGATSPSLVMSEAKAGDSGSYTVVITDPNGVSTTSSAVQLVVDSLMKNVPSGNYFINSNPEVAGHEVYLSTYNVDMYEVKQSYWEEVYAWATGNGYDFDNPGMNTDPSGITQTGEHPIHTVSWYDALKWANARSEKDGFTPCYYTDENRTTVYRKGRINLDNSFVKWTASGYRLPTEAEWEVAARGGESARRYSWGDSPFPSRANYEDTRVGKTTQVGSFPANGYGLNDMQGNISEWIWDLYDTETYEYDFKESFDGSSNSQTASLKELYLENDSLATRLRNSWRTRGAKTQILGFHGSQLSKIRELPFLTGTRVVGGYSTAGGTKKMRFIHTDGNFTEANPTNSSSRYIFFSNDSNRSFEGLEVWAQGSYTEDEQTSFSEPALGVMKVFTDQNFTDTYTLNRANRIAVPNSGPDANQQSNNDGGYKKIRSLTLGSNESVGFVSNELYGNPKCAAKIEFVYSDGTEQNSTEKIHSQSGWKTFWYTNPNPQKLVSVVNVWLSDFVGGQDHSTATEGSTNVWSLPVSESLVFADGSTSYLYQGSGFQVAKSVTFDRTSKVTRVSHELKANYNVSVQAKVEFTYVDNTEANSSLFRTSSPFTSYQAANHLNPFPGKAVEGFKIWLDRNESAASNNNAYYQFPEAFSPESGPNAEVITNYLLQGSDYYPHKEIELPQPIQISRVFNQLRIIIGGYAYCKIQFHYNDGTDANSTENSSSSSTFNSFYNYVNPSAEKMVTKITVWLRNSISSNGYKAAERATGFIPFAPQNSNGDIYNQETILKSDQVWRLIKKIDFSNAEYLEGVMNEIKNGGTGTQTCRIKFAYEDDTKQDSQQNNVGTSTFTPMFYANPQIGKKVKGIEVWAYCGSREVGYSLHERRTSLIRIPYYHMSNPPSYITFRLPQYEETDTHFKVKVDAVREAGDSIWFEIFDGGNNQKYTGTDFEKFHALPAGITKPDKLRIYMVPAPENNNPQTAITAVYWTTNDPKSVFSGWTGAPTSRVYRGEDYSQQVKEVRTRSYSSPTSITNKRGFRLVQRP